MTTLNLDSGDVGFEADPGTPPPSQTDGARARHLHPDSRPRMGRRVAHLVALALLQAPVVFDLSVPVVRPAFALLSLLAIPTLVLYRRAGLPGDSAVARFSYAFGASLLAVVVGALAINTALPRVGIDRPLTPLVLGLTWLVLDAALLSWRHEIPLLQRGATRAALPRIWAARVELAEATAVLALVLSVLGAIRLNNGAGGALALTAQFLVAGAVTALLVREGSLGRDTRVLFLIGLTLLLATSLRGWGITGHDIQAEYYAFSLTNDAQHWSMAVLDNAYNACLSVTILPTVLAQSTGLSGVVVFKVLMQVVFALVPVLVFLVSRRFLPRRLALIGVVFVVAFPTFSTDMPYLVRQEVAFLFLGLMLLAGTEPGRGVRGRRTLVVVAAVGVVLAHYSTTYLMLLGLLVATVLFGLVQAVARLRKRRTTMREPLVLLSPLVVAVVAGIAVLWTGPVTDTGTHAAEVVRGSFATLVGKSGDRPGSSDLSWSIFGGEHASSRSRLDSFVQETVKLRHKVPRKILLIKKPGPAEKRPAIIAADRAPLTGAGRLVKRTGLDPGTVSDVLRFGCAGLLQVFLLIGLCQLVFHRRRDRGVAPELTCVAVGVMAALGLVVLLPSLSVEYGVLRAFLQAMLFLAPVAAVGMWWLLRKLGRRNLAWTVGVPVALLLILSAAGPSLLGGNRAKLALHNAGLYHDRYIAADSDAAAIDRLPDAPDSSGAMPKVITSRNQVLRVITAGLTEADVADRMYPTLLTRGSYVFVDARLHQQSEATIFYSGDRVTYRYPLSNLDRRLNLVYSSGQSRIYR